MRIRSGYGASNEEIINDQERVEVSKKAQQRQELEVNLGWLGLQGPGETTLYFRSPRNCAGDSRFVEVECSLVI